MAFNYHNIVKCLGFWGGSPLYHQNNDMHIVWLVKMPKLEHDNYKLRFFFQLIHHYTEQILLLKVHKMLNKIELKLILTFSIDILLLLIVTRLFFLLFG